MMAIDLSALASPSARGGQASLFNEVFFDEVFVSDDDVVGEVGQGWTVARATLGNERCFGGGPGLIGIAPADLGTGPAAPDTGRFTAELPSCSPRRRPSGCSRYARRPARSAARGPAREPGQLLSAEHDQRVADLARRLAGPAAIIGDAHQSTWGYLMSR